jgi:hypothetical protein
MFPNSSIPNIILAPLQATGGESGIESNTGAEAAAGSESASVPLLQPTTSNAAALGSSGFLPSQLLDFGNLDSSSKCLKSYTYRIYLHFCKFH